MRRRTRKIFKILAHIFILRVTSHIGALVTILWHEPDLGVEILGLMDLSRVWFLMSPNHLRCADINNSLVACVFESELMESRQCEGCCLTFKENIVSLARNKIWTPFRQGSLHFYCPDFLRTWQSISSPVSSFPHLFFLDSFLQSEIGWFIGWPEVLNRGLWGNV